MNFPNAFADEEGKLYPDQLAYLNKMFEHNSTDDIQRLNSKLADPAVVKEAQVWSQFATSFWDEKN